jgi:hypothetical protein
VHGGPARQLVLAFVTRVEGLTFQAFWKNGEKSRIPAHGPAAHVNGNGHVTSSERAKLIGLAAYARKAHFAYQAETGLYTLGSVVEIPNFLKVTLPAWKRLFAVELDEASLRLLKGRSRLKSRRWPNVGVAVGPPPARSICGGFSAPGNAC